MTRLTVAGNRQATHDTMGKESKYVTFQTRFGWVGILASEKGLLTVSLPQPTREQARRQPGSAVEQAEHAPQRLADITERLKAYFNGEKVALPDRLDLSRATPFQQAVWQAARDIPYGETRSYQWLARQIGKPGAARAVGQALGKNPLPIIVTCHRVIASDGSLGGFTGGLEMKKRLLKLETSRETLRYAQVTSRVSLFQMENPDLPGKVSSSPRRRLSSSG